MAKGIEAFAKREIGRSTTNKPKVGGNVTVGELDLEEDEKDQLRSWGKHRDVAGNPPAWVEDEAAWERAKEQIKPKWDDYEEPWAVVVHIYKQMTGG